MSAETVGIEQLPGKRTIVRVILNDEDASCPFNLIHDEHPFSGNQLPLNRTLNKCDEAVTLTAGSVALVKDVMSI